MLTRFLDIRANFMGASHHFPAPIFRLPPFADCIIQRLFSDRRISCAVSFSLPFRFAPEFAPRFARRTAKSAFHPDRSDYIITRFTQKRGNKLHPTRIIDDIRERFGRETVGSMRGGRKPTDCIARDTGVMVYVYLYRR